MASAVPFFEGPSESPLDAAIAARAKVLLPQALKAFEAHDWKAWTKVFKAAAAFDVPEDVSPGPLAVTIALMASVSAGEGHLPVWLANAYNS